jgi:hypothetical protein
MNSKIKLVLAFISGIVGGVVICVIFVFNIIDRSKEIRKGIQNVISKKIEHLLYGKSEYDEIEDIIFDSRKDARLLIKNMTDVTDKYGFITVADYKDLIGLTVTFKDYTIGWMQNTKWKIIMVKKGYKIQLPEPIDVSGVKYK